MKGYYIEVTNNLLDAKHYKAMGDSVWLFMWLLDKITSINEKGIGKVLGGKPIKYQDLELELGISKRTYQYWIETLKAGEYINTIRTPYGLSISINKAKKKFGRRDVQKVAYPDVQRTQRDVQRTYERCATNATSNKTIQDSTKDRFYKNQKEGIQPLKTDEFLKRLSAKIAAVPKEK